MARALPNKRTSSQFCVASSLNGLGAHSTHSSACSLSSLSSSWSYSPHIPAYSRGDFPQRPLIFPHRHHSPPHIVIRDRLEPFTSTLPFLSPTLHHPSSPSLFNLFIPLTSSLSHSFLFFLRLHFRHLFGTLHICFSAIGLTCHELQNPLATMNKINLLSNI